jgi:hypothetical protein
VLSGLGQNAHCCSATIRMRGVTIQFVAAHTAVPRARTRSRIASCAASGTQTAVNSPALCNLASIAASRRLVFTRSPGFFGINEGATTVQLWPSPLSSR